MRRCFFKITKNFLQGIMSHRWKFGVLSRLPEHYKNHRFELKKEPSPVHYRPETVNYKKNPETGQITRVQNVPLPLRHSSAADLGLWGGEEIIKGFRKPGTYRRLPSFWVPHLKKTVVYSEIFDQYLSVVVTERTLRLIDQNHGFDNYILRTPVYDLKSQLALDLRRKMLLALIRKDFLKDNPEKQSKLLKKYEDCLIPEEEAEWFGLSLKAACTKQYKIEEEELNNPVPLKIQFRKDLLQQLQVAKDSGVEFTDEKKSNIGWFGKLNPFSSNEVRK